MLNYRNIIGKSIKILLFITVFFIGLISKNNFIVKSLDENEKNIIILMDKSRSMQVNDPEKLSIVAGQILMDSMDEDNINFNIITFGNSEEVKYLKKLSEKPSNEELKEFLLEVKFEDDYTDLKSGLIESMNQLIEVKGEKQIIILTDGKETVNGGITELYKKEVESIIDKAINEKVKINTIGLSQEVDKERLKGIAGRTKGDFYHSESAADLFHIFSSILGNTNEYFTLTNYTTDIKKEESINLSNKLEEVIINIASCENEVPNVQVLLNGKELEPQKYDSRYEIYKLTKGNMGKLELISKDDFKENINIQIKSEEKIIIEQGTGTLIIPKMVPMEFNISVEGNEKILGLYLEKYINGELISNINEKNKNFIDSFTINNPGKYPLRYVARDENGGILAVNEILITVEDNPPFYYEKNYEGLISGEKLVIRIVPLDNSKVEGIGGELYIEYEDGKKDKIALEEKNGVLVGEIEIKDIGSIGYWASINGKGFAYKLPYKTLNVIEKPIIDLSLKSNEEKNVKLGDAIEIGLSINKCILYNTETIDVLDENHSKIGEFQLAPNTQGEIKISVNPKKESYDMILYFKTSDGVTITEILETNIDVLMVIKYIFNEIKIPLIILATLLVIVIIVLIIGRNSYKNIENYAINKTLRYKLPSYINNKKVRFELSYINRNQCLNYYDENGEVLKCSKDNSRNVIGYFTLIFPKHTVSYEEIGFITKVIEGLRYIVIRDKYFKIEYTPTLKGQVDEKNKPIVGEQKYEELSKVIIKREDGEIRIEFKS